MKLYLVRHGESITTGDQPLSERGIQACEEVALCLKQSALELDEIMHSVKTRARQTAEIFGSTLAPDLTLVQREGLKPNDPIGPLLDEIHAFDRNVMIVSHLPFLEKLLTTLVLGSETISPVDLCGSCVICLEGAGRAWKIAWVVTPSLCHRKNKSLNTL